MTNARLTRTVLPGFVKREYGLGTDSFVRQCLTSARIVPAKLIAFYAAAIDPRIDAALVSGYFDSRQDVWSEPIYRNVWSLLREFGDAEIATLIAPRRLIVEYSTVPAVSGHKGELKTPSFARVQAETKRIPQLRNIELITGIDQRPTGPFSLAALQAFSKALNLNSALKSDDSTLADHRAAFDSAERQARIVAQTEAHVQALLGSSENVRNRFSSTR